MFVHINPYGKNVINVESSFSKNFKIRINILCCDPIIWNFEKIVIYLKKFIKMLREIMLN
jgi:hypothetical protein